MRLTMVLMMMELAMMDVVDDADDGEDEDDNLRTPGAVDRPLAYRRQYL